MCNEAALFAARGGKAAVTMTDFENAVDRIIGGLEKKNKVISKVERRTVALHEAGHAVVGWFLQYAEPLLKVRASASRAQHVHQTSSRGISSGVVTEHYCCTREMTQPHHDCRCPSCRAAPRRWALRSTCPTRTC